MHHTTIILFKHNSLVDNHQEWRSQVEGKLTDLTTNQQLKEMKFNELLESNSRDSHSGNERLEDKRLELQVEEQRRQIVQLETIPRMTKAELNTPEKEINKKLFHEPGQTSTPLSFRSLRFRVPCVSILAFYPCILVFPVPCIFLCHQRFLSLHPCIFGAIHDQNGQHLLVFAGSPFSSCTCLFLCEGSLSMWYLLHAVSAAMSAAPSASSNSLRPRSSEWPLLRQGVAPCMHGPESGESILRLQRWNSSTLAPHMSDYGSPKKKGIFSRKSCQHAFLVKSEGNFSKSPESLQERDDNN